MTGSGPPSLEERDKARQRTRDRIDAKRKFAMGCGLSTMLRLESVVVPLVLGGRSSESTLARHAQIRDCDTDLLPRSRYRSSEITRSKETLRCPLRHRALRLLLRVTDLIENSWKPPKSRRIEAIQEGIDVVGKDVQASTGRGERAGDPRMPRRAPPLDSEVPGLRSDIVVPVLESIECVDDGQPMHGDADAVVSSVLGIRDFPVE